MCKLDQHRGWQFACGLLQLICSVAMLGSSVRIELLPFQTRLIFRLQLQLADVFEHQFPPQFPSQSPQQLMSQMLNDSKVQTFVSQRLLAAQFWASQLAAEFSFQQHQQLSLQLLLPARVAAG